MNKECIVTAIVYIKPNHAEQVKSEFLKIKSLNLKQPACLEYKLHEDIEDPTRLVLYERWISQAAYEKQFEQPYILEFIDIVEDKLVRPCDVVVTAELR